MKHVLMIEDDVTLQNMYKDAFDTQNFVITTVNTGKAGLTKIREIPAPDLVILDIMLPEGMNGFDVLQEIKKDPKTSTIPVLIMTNLDTEQKTAMELGASGYLVKANTSIDVAIEKINTLLGQ
ncbi:response regulator [Candidatus Woesebacteria bacterium]|nr:response regulator [Candidatus Woesebacteria bacterium]